MKYSTIDHIKKANAVLIERGHPAIIPIPAYPVASVTSRGSVPVKEAEARGFELIQAIAAEERPRDMHMVRGNYARAIGKATK